MLTKNIDDMTARIDAHRAAYLLVQGDYYDTGTGRGCFIGCLAQGNRPEHLAETYGIPVPLTRLLERIFEMSSPADAAEFFSAIPRAIGSDGRDLSRVIWAFLGETLRALPPQPDAIQAVIDPVIVGMDLLAAGKPWSGADAARAAAAAAARARAAAAAAAAEEAWAAAAAAEEAWAAAAAARNNEVSRQRASILALMAAA